MLKFRRGRHMGIPRCIAEVQVLCQRTLQQSMHTFPQNQMALLQVWSSWCRTAQLYLEIKREVQRRPRKSEVWWNHKDRHHAPVILCSCMTLCDVKRCESPKDVKLFYVKIVNFPILFSFFYSAQMLLAFVHPASVRRSSRTLALTCIDYIDAVGRGWNVTRP